MVLLTSTYWPTLTSCSMSDTRGLGCWARTSDSCDVSKLIGVKVAEVKLSEVKADAKELMEVMFSVAVWFPF